MRAGVGASRRRHEVGSLRGGTSSIPDILPFRRAHALEPRTKPPHGQRRSAPTNDKRSPTHDAVQDQIEADLSVRCAASPDLPPTGHDEYGTPPTSSRPLDGHDFARQQSDRDRFLQRRPQPTGSTRNVNAQYPAPSQSISRTSVFDGSEPAQGTNSVASMMMTGGFDISSARPNLEHAHLGFLDVDLGEGQHRTLFQLVVEPSSSNADHGIDPVDPFPLEVTAHVETAVKLAVPALSLAADFVDPHHLEPAVSTLRLIAAPPDGSAGSKLCTRPRGQRPGRLA